MFPLCLVTMPPPLRISLVCIFFPLSYGWSKNQKGLLSLPRENNMGKQTLSWHCIKLWRSFRTLVTPCSCIKARVFQSRKFNTVWKFVPDSQSLFLFDSCSFISLSGSHTQEYVLRGEIHWGYRLREEAAHWFHSPSPMPRHHCRIKANS